MNDTQLRDWMRALPRAKASPAFTSDVLRKARLAGRADDERRAPFVWRMAAALAMVVCILGVAQIALMQYTQRQRVEALRIEQEKLEAELAEVKKIASEAEPVVVLEDDRGTRVIMDLDSAIQPASNRTFD